MITSLPPPVVKTRIRGGKKTPSKEDRKRACQLTGERRKNTITSLQVLFKYHYASDGAFGHVYKSDKRVFLSNPRGVECKRERPVYDQVFGCAWSRRIKGLHNHDSMGRVALDPNEILLSQLRVMSCTSDVFLVFFFCVPLSLKRTPKCGRSFVVMSHRAMCRQWAVQPSLSSGNDVLSSTELPSICHPDLEASLIFSGSS